MTEARVDIYAEVTNKLIAALEQGPEAWTKSWTTRADLFCPVNHATGRAYRGINLWLLAIACDERAAMENRWLTFRQALALGTPIRKGAKGVRIIFWKTLDRKDHEDATEEAHAESDQRRPMIARTFHVFNAADCEGVPAEPVTFTPDCMLAARILDASGAAVVAGKPSYCPGDDVVRLPPVSAFASQADYFATAFHELAHWTAPRVKRELNAKRFGDRAYAIEELTAELAAAMLCRACGLPTLMQSASYISDWLKVLREDKRAVFSVASAAQKAADYLLERAGLGCPPSHEASEAA
jgi:antirestriction protein ArdC